MVTDAAAAHGASVQPSVTGAAIARTGDIGKGTLFRPDVLVRLADRERLPIDAKYKKYDKKSLDADDIHQLLTYIGGYTTVDNSTGLIIHPHRDGRGHRTLKVAGPRGLLGTIQVIGIDTMTDPHQAAKWLDSQWQKIVDVRKP